MWLSGYHAFVKLKIEKKIKYGNDNNLIFFSLLLVPKAKLKNCPRNIEVQADKGEKSTKVYWTPPTEIHHYK